MNVQGAVRQLTDQNPYSVTSNLKQKYALEELEPENDLPFWLLNDLNKQICQK